MDARVGRAVDDRAGAGGGRRRARQPVRRRSPQRPGALLPERRRSSAACSRSGTTGRRARCSCCRCGIRCCSPSRSARSPSIARGPFIMQCAVGGGEEQFRVLRHDAARAGDALRGRARHRPRAVPGRDGDDHRRTVEDRPGAASRPSRPSRCEVWIGAAAPRADRPRGPARRRVPHRPGGDAARGRRRSCETYRDACARHGRDADAGSRCAATSTSRPPTPRPPPSPDPIVARGYRGFDPSAVVVGGPDRVDRRLRGASARPGCTDVIVRHLADDQGAVLRSFEQLATVRENLR